MNIYGEEDEMEAPPPSRCQEYLYKAKTHGHNVRTCYVEFVPDMSKGKANKQAGECP